MKKAFRKGACLRCGFPKCGWYQANEPCLRSSEEIEAWMTPPGGCKYLCGELGEMELREGTGPHAAQWTCPTCGRWQAWVPKWKLALLLGRTQVRLAHTHAQ